MQQKKLADPVESTDQIFFLDLYQNMSARELRSLGLTGPSTDNNGFVTRSGRTRNQQVFAAQNERQQRRGRRGRALRTTRAFLRGNMGTRPFTLQEQFGGVWRTFDAIPFEDIRRYDYEQWIYSFTNQMRQKLRRELQQGART